MAKIWYSVLGDGMGHALRSDIILKKITKEHEVFITATKKAYHFLKDKYENVYEIEGQELLYEENKVKVIRTVTQFFKDLPKKSKINMSIIPKLLYSFKPDIVISDFEPLSHYYASILKIPSISIDNVHTLSECEIKEPPGQEFELKRAIFLIKFLHLRSDYYILTAFANAIPKKKNTIIVPPIVREEVRKLKSEKGEHVLVYQTTPTNTKILEILKKSNNKFKIYGMKGLGKQGNLEFMPFSETQILEDMRKAKYIIVNGGFTVISESLYLKKPILAIPIKDQLEQEFNGYSLKERGYGDYAKELSQEVLEKFEKKLPKYQQKLKKMKKWNHEKIFKELNKIIRILEKESNPKYELLKPLTKLKNK
ncbi:hypothetical protein K9L67_00345 [Candidatus Woesearchaeota archaeon]|nr:hypothetical protein [Candidatus Woesearchaeota archaeon]MCF7900656.1 hypothetical protein [Candidatus Woesearchaeota archaeon]MCF8013509.1 hypothetical protein [Candidatus Woesearchaeota archaeon]